MNRRGFLGSILALGAAPAIVRASSLMPVRPVLAVDLGAGDFTAVIECQIGRFEGFRIIESRSVAWDGLVAWWGEQYDRLTLDYLIAQDKPPLQFNRIVRAT